MVQWYDEQRRKNVERSSRSVIYLEGLGTPRNISDRTVGLLAETWNRVVPAKKQECYPLDYDVQYFAVRFVRTWNSVYPTKWRTQSQGVREQDAEENIWT
jgi:hypothetical protein